jgi:hypothetical protein
MLLEREELHILLVNRELESEDTVRGPNELAKRSDDVSAVGEEDILNDLPGVGRQFWSELGVPLENLALREGESVVIRQHCSFSSPPIFDGHTRVSRLFNVLWDGNLVGLLA